MARYLSRSIALVAVILTLAGVGASTAAEAVAPRITVTGEATLAVIPDRAQITAGVTTQGRTAGEALAANTQAMKAVVAAARAAGIAEPDIATARFSVMPVHAFSPAQTPTPEPPRVVAYRVSNQVTVKLREPSQAGDLLDRLIAAGATDVGGVSFTVHEPEKMLNTARPQAIADARQKAELYAKAASARVGRALRIEEANESQPVFRSMQREAMGASATPISPGEAMLKVSVSVTFELLY
jgi:uncharacterized protein